MTQEQEVRVAALDIALRFFLGSDKNDLNKQKEEPKKGTPVYDSQPPTPEEVIADYAHYFECLIINGLNQSGRPY
jgi:hypothetical protein